MPPVNAEEIRQLVRRLIVEAPPEIAAGARQSDLAAVAARPDGASAEAAPGGTRRIAIGADHGGFRLKDRLAEHLRGRGFAVTDLGTANAETVDYPDFAHAVAARVALGECEAGIVVDGAGIGSCIAANKVPGVRAALCYDLSTAANAREHNYANVLTLGAGMIGEALAKQIVDRFLDTPFGAERHARRVAKIAEIENTYLAPAMPAMPEATR
jgi:ribose 5-phosphate isomerase B